MAKLNHDPEEYDYDFSLRKDLHVKFYTDIHHNFKASAAKLKLSMQEILQEMARSIIEEDPRALQILSDYKKNKRKRDEKSLIGKADVDEIFDIIGEDSPFGND